MICISPLWVFVVPMALGEAAELREESMARFDAVILQAQRMSKPEALFADRVAVLASCGREILPYLTRRVQTGEGDALSITAIGFLAEERDSDVMDVLASLAFVDGAPHRRDAIMALLRIGGEGVSRTVAKLEEGRFEPELASWLLDTIWLLPDVEDLEKTLEALERISARDKPGPLRVLAAAGGVPRLRAVLDIRRNGATARNVERVKSILHQREAAFATIAGGVAERWAADRMVESKIAGTAEELRSFMRHAARDSLAPGVRRTLLVAVERTGSPLTVEERKWLDAHRSPDVGQQMPLGLSLDELLAAHGPGRLMDPER
ncbi:MAG: hypothetical protein HY763_06400 [Planctomycetes bacterium]|nr:hypothetical protein [Planctomycetota bacterium]